MKIIALSDLHLDINSKRKDPNFTQELIKYLRNLRGDALIIAGDIAGNTKSLVHFFEMAQDLPFNHKLFVPGNHDIWVNQKSNDLSLQKYDEILPEIITQFSFDYLPQNPLLVDDIAFFGTMGWYDYSSRNTIWDDKYPMSNYHSKIHPEHNIELMDRHFAKFGLSDDEISQKMNRELIEDYEFIKKRVEMSDKIKFVNVTHMVPFREFIPYRGLFKYDYFTAFFGNMGLGKIIREQSLGYESYAIFGQCHIPNSKKVSDDLMGYCVPIGYPREYGMDISLEKLFTNRIIEINV